MSAKKPADAGAVVRVTDVPDYLLQVVKEGAGDSSVETMQHHHVLARLDITQSNSPRDKKEKYGEGAIFIPSTETKLADLRQKVDLVPVMFFDEFLQWGDRNDKAGPMIRDRSLDHASALAAKCGNAGKWYEKYGDDGKGGQFEARNSHHMNFVCVVYGDHPLKGTIVVLSMHRSAYKKGEALVGAIRARRIAGKQAPMWSTVWSVWSAAKSNDDGEWYGWDFESSAQPWVAKEDLEAMEGIHEKLKEEYRNQLRSEERR